MGREGAASPKGLPGTTHGPSIKIPLHLRPPFGVKGAALAAAVVALGSTEITVPALGGRSGPWRIDPVVCKTTISAVPPHTVAP